MKFIYYLKAIFNKPSLFLYQSVSPVKVILLVIFVNLLVIIDFRFDFLINLRIIIIVRD
jgi:hypothetical protein